MDRCYWCLKDDNLLNCDFCNRIFCNECSKQDYISESKCIVCVINDFSPNSEFNDKVNYCIREELNYLSQLVSDKENIHISNLDDLSINEMPMLFELLGDNAIQFLSDITKITKCIKRCLENNHTRFAEEVLNPCSKFIIRHFMCNAIGKISTVIQEDDMEMCNSNSFISQMIKATDITTQIVQISNNVKQNRNSSLTSIVNKSYTNNSALINENDPLSLSMGGLSTESFVINEENDEDEYTDVAEDCDMSNASTNQFLLPCHSNNLQKRASLNNSKKNKSKDVYQRNRHLVPPVAEGNREKNFILVEPCKELLNQVNNSPSKKWSWSSISDTSNKLKRNNPNKIDMKVPVKMGKVNHPNTANKVFVSKGLPFAHTNKPVVVRKIYKSKQFIKSDS